MRTRIPSIAAAGAALFLAACGDHKTEALRTVTKQSFGKTAAGDAVELYTLRNTKGMSASIMNYGGTVVSLQVPGKDGKSTTDVIHGFDTLDGYLGAQPYFGALIGRYGNRIGKGEFSLNGKVYKLAKNNGENALHGGLKGFDKVVWTVQNATPDSLSLRYVSKDGEEGYPGTLTADVTYTLTDNQELQIDYQATSDQDTVVNLTNHSYFNLAGEGDILGHQIQINADKFTPIDKGLITTGELRPVAGTPFDFTKPEAIGARIDANDEQIKYGLGYDHNFVLNKTDSSLTMAAKVIEPKSGRTMEVWTTEPGVQFYTGNFLDGTLKGKGGHVYAKRSAFCLETQHFPDSPNKPSFPSVVLKPGQKLKSSTLYRFGHQ